MQVKMIKSVLLLAALIIVFALVSQLDYEQEMQAALKQAIQEAK